MRNWAILTIMLILPLLAAPLVGRLYRPIEIPAAAQAEAQIIGTQTTGFTIFQRQQVTPKYITISDNSATMEYLNPGPVPSYPPTFGVKLCYSVPFNLYSAYDSERLEVWQDAAGTATVQEILAVCPQFTR